MLRFDKIVDNRILLPSLCDTLDGWLEDLIPWQRYITSLGDSNLSSVILQRYDTIFNNNIINNNI